MVQWKVSAGIRPRACEMKVGFLQLYFHAMQMGLRPCIEVSRKDGRTRGRDNSKDRIYMIHELGNILDRLSIVTVKTNKIYTQVLRYFCFLVDEATYFSMWRFHMTHIEDGRYLFAMYGSSISKESEMSWKDILVLRCLAEFLRQQYIGLVLLDEISGRISFVID
jgi:hypothetical protein